MSLITVYCPRGCNIVEASEDDPYDECASCGALMTASDERNYSDVHEEIENRAIAQFESD